METTISTTTVIGNIVTFKELLPFQDWAYVEVVRDYHKHLGNDDTTRKIAVLNETIKPYRKAKGNERAALQFLTLAVYMGGILTNDCMRALEMVKAHREKMAATPTAQSKTDVPKGWGHVDPHDDAPKPQGKDRCTTVSDKKPEPERKATQTAKASTQTAKSDSKGKGRFLTPEEIAIWMYGSVEAMDEVVNDFFGFDVKKSSSMSGEEFVKYYKRVQEVGWRKA